MTKHGLPVEERFWPKVDRSGGPDACWHWLAGRRARNYGCFNFDGKRSACSHRVSWVLAHGPIPDGLHVLHRCDNPPCVNPAHLFLGTQADNNRDRDQKGRARKPNRGERHNKAKLTCAKVAELRARYAAGECFSALARAFGVTRAAARRATHGLSWKDVPGAAPEDPSRQTSGRRS